MVQICTCADGRQAVGCTQGTTDGRSHGSPVRTPGGKVMFKLTLRYSRYALTALASVGFKIVLN